MAVGNNLTLVEDMEGGGPTTTNWPTGGQGASNDTDLFFEGLAATSMKVDNTTKGYWMNPGGTFDLSGAGEHLKLFAAITTPALLNGYRIGIGSVANTDFEIHEIDLSFYPATAGWVPVWVEVDAGADTNSPDFTIADEFGAQADMGNVGGNLKNFLTDIIHHGTRPTLIWSGTGGDLDDFITSEDTNAWGVLGLKDGIYTCGASLQIGDSSETAFDAAGKTIVFPNAIWLPTASAFMGLDFDLAHASTVLDWTGGAVLGGATRKPDLIVVGTSGALDLTGRVLTNMRIVTLTSGVTADNTVITTSGAVTPVGASMLGAFVLESSVAANESALVYNEAADPDGELDNMTFTQGAAAHHAIELGLASPLTLTLTGHSYTGFDATPDSDGATIHVLRTSLTVTINYTGDEPSIKTEGATVITQASASYTINSIQDPSEVTILDRDVEMLDITGSATTLAFGDATATERMGQSFQVGATAKVERVRIRLRKVGTPTDGVRIRIVDGVPGSTELLVSTPRDAADITTSFVEYDLDLDGKTELTSATTYGFEIERTGAVNGSDYYEIEYDTGDPHGSGVRYIYNTSWGSSTGDLLFTVMEAASDNELYHVEAVTTGTTVWNHDGTARQIEVLVMATNFLQVFYLDNVDATDRSNSVVQIPDRVYSNPT